MTTLVLLFQRSVLKPMALEPALLVVKVITLKAEFASKMMIIVLNTDSSMPPEDGPQFGVMDVSKSVNAATKTST